VVFGATGYLGGRLVPALLEAGHRVRVVALDPGSPSTPTSGSFTPTLPREALEWWRVELLERPRLLRLRAEMRVPGRDWLELSAEPAQDGGAHYRQRAIFEPHGLAGHLYWNAITRSTTSSSVAWRATSLAPPSGGRCRYG
jgi:Protein of unknown function (DUF2867)/NmrA-like family